MAWAKNEGISDGSNLDGNVTRAQIAAMLFRYAGIGEDGYADGKALEWVQSVGIMNDGRGNDFATRAEAAAMMMRFMSLD